MARITKSKISGLGREIRGGTERDGGYSAHVWQQDEEGYVFSETSAKKRFRDKADAEKFVATEVAKLDKKAA